MQTGMRKIGLLYPFDQLALLEPGTDHTICINRDNNFMNTMAKPFIIINKIKYFIISVIGIGVFGVAVKVLSEADRLYYCIKIQIVQKDDPRESPEENIRTNTIRKTNSILEAMIHYCLAEKGLALTLLYVARMNVDRGGINVECVCYLMDIAKYDLKSLLVAPIDNTRIVNLIKPIARLLQQAPNFNHGDFHPGNILIDHRNKVYLSDFGQSLYTEEGGVLFAPKLRFIGGGAFTKVLSPSRDLTRLFWSMYCYYREAGQELPICLRPFICQSEKEKIDAGMNMFDLETLFNEGAINEKATYDAVLANPHCPDVQRGGGAGSTAVQRLMAGQTPNLRPVNLGPKSRSTRNTVKVRPPPTTVNVRTTSRNRNSTTDLFEYNSLEYFCHYLIFTKFKKASLADKLALTSKIFNMDRKNIAIIVKIPIKRAIAILRGSKKSPINFELYCEETDPETAFMLLRFLLFTTMDKEQYTAFKTTYASLDSKDKKGYLPTNIWNAKFL